MPDLDKPAERPIDDSTSVKAPNDQSQVDYVRREIDSQRFLLRSVLSVGSFLIVGLAAAFVYLVAGSLAELKREVVELAGTRVDAVLRDRVETSKDFDSLLNDLQQAEVDYEKVKVAIDAMSGLTVLADLSERDPFGTYKKLSLIDDENAENDDVISDESRAVASALIADSIDTAKRGLAEPNTIFNTAVVASRLNFNSEAVRLAVLADYWKPSVSHASLKSELESLYGVRYTFDGNDLSQTELPAAEVRQTAWDAMIETISDAPTHEGEQAYSRLSNVANRNRSLGSYGQAIEAIEASDVASGQNLTSYAYATLASLYLVDSKAGWEEGFWEATQKAILAWKSESPLASWHRQTASLILRRAQRVNLLPEFFELSDRLGVERVDWLNSLQNGDGPEFVE